MTWNQTDDKAKKLDSDRNNFIGQDTKKEFTEALKPVVSVISKCEKGQGKFAAGTAHYQRFENLIKAMVISKALIEDQLELMECSSI